MRPFASLAIILFILSSCTKDEKLSPEFYVCAEVLSSGDIPDAAKYQALVNDMSSNGVPGAMMTIRKSSFAWSGASGKADLGNNIPLRSCNITRAGSTVKTFTAVTIMLLQEEGKLNLDDPITNYLSREQIRDLENAENVTIRHLLQHSSGIYNYIVNPEFQTASLNDLKKVWSRNDLLSYAENMPAEFSPDTEVEYSNTNYILLGDIITSIEKKNFYTVFKEKIFTPLNLQYTQFAAEDPIPNGLVRGYVDFYGNFNVIDATHYSGWDYFTADGGLISNAYDLSLFMQQLFEGSLLKPESLTEMMTWRAPSEQDSEGYKTYYGYGIFKIETNYGPAYMHSGDAIGYFATMLYFPDHNTSVSWAANGNYGAIDEHSQSKNTMDKVFETIFQ